MFLRNRSLWTRPEEESHPVVQAFGAADETDHNPSRGSLWKTIAILLVISLVWIGVVAVVVWLFQPTAAQAGTLPGLMAEPGMVAAVSLVPRIPHPAPCRAALPARRQARPWTVIVRQSREIVVTADRADVGEQGGCGGRLATGRRAPGWRIQ